MRQLIRRPSRACVPFLVVALMAPAAAVRAETPATPAPATAPRSVMYEAAQVAARPAASAPVEQQRAATDAVRMERHVGAGKNAALMVVGAAGIITGAVVGGGGGAAIAIGGAAVGLYGLYRFMK
ncbi:hypothetical protein J421_6232 (plasmid) [Gemmatirosa kalamazoonensis]|jgi:hypothetical protein|uniref:Uncharacterized protein n=1 Tax=Gemmatirosa kalamazoonensis TaxID=861299 RepID=W0RTJ6_9BACT|nr:hypothetical protein [Gemmatirosa kalamazoonensis]AHG93767.1 hypothetical protein J421_6232 [Gemmatirosa kalamazoonensis]